MFTIKNEINEVYLKVDSLFKLKLKLQIKGSGLDFMDFFHVNDLVRETIYYYLIVNDKEIIFNNIDELYDGLVLIINHYQPTKVNIFKILF